MQTVLPIQGGPSAFAYIMMAVRGLRFTSKSIPAAFAVLTVLAYGLLLPLTGFYWDDWPFAWIAKFLGPAEFIPAFQGFRPFLGPIFFATTSLIPPNPLLWQLFALVVHFAAGLGAWFALDQVWPKHRHETLAAALLLLVYPGYSQHWVAYTHINQEWIPFVAYLVSLGLGARALRSGRPSLLLVASALLLEAIGLFPTEYFIGIEPLRLLFFWVIAAEATKGFGGRLARSLKAWWPYLLIWLADLIWLVRYYGSGAYVSYDLTATSTPPAFGQTLNIFGDALWKAGLYVWAQVVVLLAASLKGPTNLLTLALIAAAFVLAAVYLSKLVMAPKSRTGLPKDTHASAIISGAASDPRGFAAPAMIIGVAGIVLGRVPSFAAGLPLTLQSSFDRFMISMMLGASLFAVGLIAYVLRNQKARTLTIAALLALAAGQQFFNANIFRRDWQRQSAIYWQFAWRIPALQPGTAVITTQMPLDYETDLSMTAALNWIYASHLSPPELPYALVYSEKRLGGIVLPDLTPNTPMQLPFRTMEFAGSTSQAVVVYAPNTGCLRVLDASRRRSPDLLPIPRSLDIAYPPLQLEAHPGRSA